MPGDAPQLAGDCGDGRPDPERCPLCGASNRCAMADPATRDAALTGTQQCWCVSARVDPAQLARVPLDARQRACLCPACAAGLDATAG